MNRPKRILFRADSGVEIGHGHASRVESLARAVVRSGGEARIVARRLFGHRPPAMDLPPVLWLEGKTVAANNDAALQCDALATLSAAHTAGFVFNLVVVDHYGLGPTWERTVRASGANVVALDDYPGRPHSANQVVELLPSAAAAPGRLAGLEYLPMDGAYNLPPVAVPANGLRVVVTFGAWDPTGHTVLALDALDRLDALVPGLVAHADIVVGAAHPAPDAVAARVVGFPRRALHFQLPSLAPLMRDAHVVLTAAGNAMTEAVAAGRRVLAIVTSDNQMVLADALAAAGAVYRLSRADATTAAALAKALCLIAGPLGRSIDAALDRRPIDAFGADRLVAALAPYAKLEAV
jgi:UDP-2,4-diacetamido-2,4,6-trideoxy-beta-L-altropyranose hydrolase